MLERIFRLRENGTTAATEMLAGLTTFLTMAYIIFLQPAVLSGLYFNNPNGMDPGAVMTATCVSAALATAIMGLYARYPIAQAPGMGENFIFVLSAIPAAAVLIDARVAAGTLQAGQVAPWQVALGVIFIAGVLFLALSLLGVREAILDVISPSMRNGIAAGIGLFIAFIGFQGASVIVAAEGQLVRLNPQVAAPDVLVFAFGLLVTAGLFGRRVRGSIVLGILLTTALATALQWLLPHLPEWIAAAEPVKQSKLMNLFKPAAAVVAQPPSMSPTFFKMNFTLAVAGPMIPFIFVFLFLNVFDTIGTLLGVSEHAGFIKDGRLPRAREALVSDALGTVVGAACGTSTVTSFIESAAGVQQGGRTGMTALVTAALFLVALFFAPLIEMVGSYPAITAPALVLVGAMMMRNVTKIEWSNEAEAIPAFITFLSVPLTFSIADGLALGFISYPVIKFLAGQGRDVKWLMYVLSAVLAAYLVFVRGMLGSG
ncbi:MAG: NCS2 family permease [Thermoguttaceae bacterium]|jgi:AGZA family xanthine/uracil permease-like MFS transporter